jgi:hypothetical protein
MKKIYMSPEVDVIEIKNQQTLLAGSVTLDIVEEPSIDPATVDAILLGEEDLDFYFE